MASIPPRKHKQSNIAMQILYGRFLSLDFFRDNWVSVLLVMLAMMIYITNRYQCLTRMEQIRALEQDLEIVETERIRECSNYMSRIRESSMQQMVDSMHLGLTIRDQPPYKLPPR